MGNWLKTILWLIASAFLTHSVESFSSFFRNIDTMIHETGHALMTLALSGQVRYIELYSNHSGVTLSALGNSWSFIPVALAGYMTASLFTWFLFRMYQADRQKLGLQVVTFIAILCLVLFVRNGFGMMWVGGFILLNLLMLSLLGRTIQNLYYLLLCFLTLEESVFGPFSLIIYAVNDPKKAGDASNLAEVTGFPAVVWAVFLTIFALWCAKGSIQAFFGKKKKARKSILKNRGELNHG